MYLTSFPTVIEAMTFFTASFFFSFLSLFSSAFSSKISPVSVKYRQLEMYKKTQCFDQTRQDPPCLTFLGGGKILGVRHVCSGLSHLAARRGRMAVTQQGICIHSCQLTFQEGAICCPPPHYPFNRKGNTRKVRRGERPDEIKLWLQQVTQSSTQTYHLFRRKHPGWTE